MCNIKSTVCSLIFSWVNSKEFLFWTGLWCVIIKNNVHLREQFPEIACEQKKYRPS